MGDLTGKVAIVTGAGRGLGREEAIQLAKQGARVVINDIGIPAAEEAAQEAVEGHQHKCLRTNVQLVSRARQDAQRHAREQPQVHRAAVLPHAQRNDE